MTQGPAWPQGYALVEFESLDSTSNEARRLAERGLQGPVWIRAGRQTAGRGRRGRAWESPEGNLAATLLLRPQQPPAMVAQLSFAAALSVVDALHQFADGARLEVKWPNDVLAEGRKIAGILLESANRSGPVDWLAVGIGVNLAHFPAGTEFPATSLAMLGCPAPAPQDVMRCLAAEWAKWYEAWRCEGFASIRDGWLARVAGLGCETRVRLQNEETTGVFEGIDEAGALLLRESPDRLRVIAAGDVLF